jgi:hypothetical protein
MKRIAPVVALAFAAAIAALAVVGSIGAGSPDGSTSVPAKAESAEEAKEVKVLLAALESDDDGKVQGVLRGDLVERIKAEGLGFLALETTKDRIEGQTLNDLARSAAVVGQDYGYDIVVWGGVSGSITMVAVTVVKRPGEGFRTFRNQGFTQYLQFHLDVPFEKQHGMVADAVAGLARMIAGDSDGAIDDLARALARDPDKVFRLSALRFYLGACFLDRFARGHDAEDGRRAVKHFAEPLDELKVMDSPVLYGSVKVGLAYAYRDLVALVPDQAETYRRKTDRAAGEALEVFSAKAFPELNKQLAAEFAGVAKEK